MPTKGSALSRAIRFFEEADFREARAAFTIVTEVMNARAAKEKESAKSQQRAVSTPRKQRRTKAQIAADAAQAAARGTEVPERPLGGARETLADA